MDFLDVQICAMVVVVVVLILAKLIVWVLSNGSDRGELGSSLQLSCPNL